MSTQTELEDDWFDYAGITIFNLAVAGGQRTYIDDGRKAIEQLADKLQEFASKPGIKVVSAHFEPCKPTIFITDVVAEAVDNSKVSSSISSSDDGAPEPTTAERYYVTPQIILYNVGLLRGKQSATGDDRNLLVQFIELLREYERSPTTVLLSAHYEADPDLVTLILRDPTHAVAMPTYLGIRKPTKMAVSPAEPNRETEPTDDVPSSGEESCVLQHKDGCSGCTERAGVTTMSIPRGQRDFVDDGRASIDQFLDKMRAYASDSKVKIELAHYEPGKPTIFVNGVVPATISSSEDVVTHLEQFIEKLQEYRNDPTVKVESAHYEPGPDSSTFFVSYPDEVEEEDPATEQSEQRFDPSKTCDKIHYFESWDLGPMHIKQGSRDKHSIYVFLNEGSSRDKGYQTMEPDGRMLVDQYMDLLQQFLGDPKVDLEGAHFNATDNTASFYLSDPPKPKKKKGLTEKIENAPSTSKPVHKGQDTDDDTK
uniref:Uncharacterized protein n=2 Tax=Kalmanozyma brasiliensis (strain GHG001) TaxID=1365824 RepID=V5GR81_KALBG